MVLRFWGLVAVLVLCQGRVVGAPLDTTSIVINEINYNSSDAFNPDDWIEFYNRSTQSVDMSGWVFKDIDEPFHAFVFPNGTILDADQYVVVCRHLDQFHNVYPNINVLGELGFGLSGGGEPLVLYDNQNALVDSLVYDDKTPWPFFANGKGATLQLINAELNNADVQSWKDSDEVGGSPGKANNLRRGYLVINEVMAQNTQTLSDAQGEYNDWIELYNARDESLSLNGLFLTDNFDEPQKWSFPDTSVAPRGYLLIWMQSETDTNTPLHTNFRLSKDGEQIGLFDKNSWFNAPLDTIRFGIQQRDVSIGRLPNGTGQVQTLFSATPSEQNNVPTDFDANGYTDFDDFLLFAAHFGLSQRDMRYDKKYDLNQNGAIDFPDFLSFLPSFQN